MQIQNQLLALCFKYWNTKPPADFYENYIKI
jgi:hypothetical protein